MILDAISLSVVPLSVSKTLQKNEANQDDFPVLIIQCTSPHTALVVLQMVYFTALTIANNALAMLTIHFPQNFNESKSVAFALGLMWLLILILLHCSEHSSQFTHHPIECFGFSIVSVWTKSVYNDSLAKAKCSDVHCCEKFQRTSCRTQ